MALEPHSPGGGAAEGARAPGGPTAGEVAAIAWRYRAAWPAAGQAQLARGEVHVWVCDLDEPRGSLLEVLSSSERARAAAILREPARRRWACGRALLRTLLAGYLGADAAGLRLHAGPGGKPELDGHEGAPWFNLSHAGEIGLFAFAQAGPIGVDVESGARRVDADALAHRALGAAEAARLHSLPRAERGREFLRAWVRREAQVKCLGVGLAGDPSQALTRWVADLALPRDYVGALAAHAAPESILGMLACMRGACRPTRGGKRR